MTRWTTLACVLMLGCGGGGGGAAAVGSTGGPSTPSPPAGPTELEVRRDAACEALGPRLTACAVEEARRTMSPEELAKLDLEKTAPAHTDEFIAECKRQQLSSRQVRVYEVCLQEESECEPLVACLDHVNPTAGETGGEP